MSPVYYSWAELGRKAFLKLSSRAYTLTPQDVLVFASETYGHVLVLDGAIQCTERDEFS